MTSLLEILSERKDEINKKLSSGALHVHQSDKYEDGINYSLVKICYPLSKLIDVASQLGLIKEDETIDLLPNVDIDGFTSVATQVIRKTRAGSAVPFIILTYYTKESIDGPEKPMLEVYARADYSDEAACNKDCSIINPRSWFLAYKPKASKGQLYNVLRLTEASAPYRDALERAYNALR